VPAHVEQVRRRRAMAPQLMGQVVLMPSVGNRNTTWIFFEGVKDDQQVRRRAIPSIQLPNDRDIASVHKRERLRQFMSLIGGARGVVLKNAGYG
jgi:hypothetical protein